MSDRVVAASCLNGEIVEGDHVAVAVSDGKNGSGMRYGYVEEILSETRIRVRVTRSSGFTGKRYVKDEDDHWHLEEHEYSKVFSDLDRVVRAA